ncbi:hypothetical protein [Dactylosporangium matsuzakiense]|uniref:hypothetical protein n=1 Tax=Dactylosporangium matsuzakiense TaxID=53360 RepID=UPI0021C35E4E|nr:hypothetical protein [Dactylosporangium matsuzakiense]UWZ47793.1 hypothetical protein Dmats_16150 [Dactylosporangium matsuzakiense]
MPWRRTLGLVAGVTSVAAIGGAVQLITGTYTPPVSDLEPVGLHSWVVPGLWLAASVAVPCACVTLLAWHRSPRVGTAAIVAGLLLGVELVVQIPFVGLDVLQAVMGIVALALLGLGFAARGIRGPAEGNLTTSTDPTRVTSYLYDDHPAQKESDAFASGDLVVRAAARTAAGGAGLWRPRRGPGHRDG